MALRFIDSFDHYATADRLTKWTAGVSNAPTITTGGRFGTSCLQCAAQVTGSGGQGLSKSLGTPAASFVVGGAFKLLNAGVIHILARLRDAGSEQVYLQVSAAGLLQFTRNGVVLATGTTPLGTGSFYFIEVKVTIDNSGSFEVRLNGVTEISGSGVDTQNTANATADQLVLLSGSTFGFQVDDLYVLDTSGGSPTDDFLGDVRVQTLMPNDNGNSSQFDGSDGNSIDNYLLVDEATPNGDTDYVESPDATDKDTYAYTDLTPTTGTVFAVQALPYSRKTEAGARSIISVARLSGTESDGATIALTDAYLYRPHIFEAKPGGGAWTISDVNSAEFGYKVA